MIVLFVIGVQIGMLSILIAQLSLAYEHLSTDKKGYAKMNRCRSTAQDTNFNPTLPIR